MDHTLCSLRMADTLLTYLWAWFSPIHQPLADVKNCTKWSRCGIWKLTQSMNMLHAYVDSKHDASQIWNTSGYIVMPHIQFEHNLLVPYIYHVLQYWHIFRSRLTCKSLCRSKIGWSNHFLTYLAKVWRLLLQIFLTLWHTVGRRAGGCLKQNYV